MKKSFCFILNPLEVKDASRIELIPGHVLQKASPEQVELIKWRLEKSFQNEFSCPAYEYEWIDEKRDAKGNLSRTSQVLPQDQWRYWVVEFDGPNTDIHELALAVNLLRKDLDLGFQFLHWGTDGQAIMLGGAATTSFFSTHRVWGGNGAEETEACNFVSVNDFFQRIKRCEKEHQSIFKAVNNFFQLKSLPRNSSMVVLGYFSVIEALVTHKPRLNESLDSLNHQVSTKMVLLSKRFQRQLDYDFHFGELEKEKVWKLLYGYRSSVAHGIHAEFGSEFKRLKDPSNILVFMKEAVKLTLLLAMEEPEFLADLKKC